MVSIRMLGARQVELHLYEKDLSCQLRSSRDWIPEAQQRLNSLQLMIWCLISVGRIISWDAKAIMSILRSYIRKISRQFSPITTEELPVPKEISIWILGIFLSPTESKRVTFILSIVQPTIWSRIFYQTSSRQEISPVQKSNYESTGLKSTLTKGVCWESTYFILHKLYNVWIPVRLICCLISYT